MSRTRERTERSLSSFLQSASFLLSANPGAVTQNSPNTSVSNTGKPAEMLEQETWGLWSTVFVPTDTQSDMKNDTSNVNTYKWKGKEKKDPITKMYTSTPRGLARTQEMSEACWARLKEERIRMERTSEICEGLKGLTFQTAWKYCSNSLLALGLAPKFSDQPGFFLFLKKWFQDGICHSHNWRNFFKRQLFFCFAFDLGK